MAISTLTGSELSLQMVMAVQRSKIFVFLCFSKLYKGECIVNIVESDVVLVECEWVALIPKGQGWGDSNICIGREIIYSARIPWLSGTS